MRFTFNTLDCGKSLEDMKFQNPAAIKYKPTGAGITIAPDYTQIWKHTQMSDCKLSYCVLKQ